jgi:predicted anti-sigma-YlaC factor YlaD
MTCRSFILALEDYFDTHPEGARLSRELSQHVAACPACAARYREAAQSRVLMASLRAARPAPQEDPYFLTRVKALIASQEQVRGWLPFRVVWRDVLGALAIFLVTLGTFVYDVHRVESPSVDEAIAVNVPHASADHPAQDHLPDGQNVMLTLLQP